MHIDVHNRDTQLGYLHVNMVNSFNLEELRGLCLVLDLRYEDLAGDTLSAKTQSFLEYHARRKSIPELICRLNKERRDVDWDAYQPEELGHKPPFEECVGDDNNEGNQAKSRISVPTWVVTVAIILILAVVAFAIYWVFFRPCSWNDPVINALEPTLINVPVNGSTTITAHAIDREDGPLTYNWSADHGYVPGGNPGPRITYTAPSTTGDGTDTIRVTVSDGRGGICKEGITLSIIDTLPQVGK